MDIAVFSSRSASQMGLSWPVPTTAMLKSYKDREGEGRSVLLWETFGLTSRCWYFQVITGSSESGEGNRHEVQGGVEAKGGL